MYVLVFTRQRILRKILLSQSIDVMYIFDANYSYYSQSIELRAGLILDSKMYILFERKWSMDEIWGNIEY